MLFSKDVLSLVEEVQELVRRGEVDVKETDCDGNNILHIVCSLDKEKSEVVQFLVSVGAAVNQVNREGETPLIIFAGKGYLSTLRVLLNNGACVDPHGAVKQGQDSAILAAVKNGQVECAEELMKHGADVWYKNSEGSNVLMVASRKGLTDIVKHCVQQEALNSINLNEVDTEYQTALFHACQNGHIGCVKILLEREEYSKHYMPSTHGGETSPLLIAVKEKHEACALELLCRGASMTDKGSGDETLLMTASANGLVKIVRKCLEKLDEGEIQAYDREGRTAIMYACQSKQSHCLEELLDSGKCSKATINKASNSGFTSLMICAQNGFMTGLKLLIQHNALVDHVISTGSSYYRDSKSENKNGNSALILAARSKHEECVRELIDYKADVWFINKIGQNLLMIASEQGLVDTVKYCLSHGNVAQIIASDGVGDTALFYAYRNNQVKCLEALLVKDKQSSDTSRNDMMVNQYSNRSQGNLIHLACQEETDKPHIIELLVSNCSLIDVSDSNGCTPLMLCAQNGHLESLKVLVKHGASIDIVQCSQNKSTHGRMPSMNSALLMAMEAKHLECTLQLIDSGADIWHVNNTGDTLLTLASKMGFIQVIKHCLNKKKTAGKLFEKYHDCKINESLLLAVEHTQEDCALELLPYSTDIWGGKGRNVLELAAENGLLNVVKTFLTNDISKEVRKITSQDIKCAVLMAAEKRQCECVKEILYFLKTGKLEVDMNEILNKLLSKSILQNSEEMLSQLVSTGVSVNAEVDGCTPLLLCAEHGCLKTLKFLLGHGADVNVSDSNQVSPLLRAAERGHENCVSELLSNGAEISHVNKRGETLLMLAAKNDLLTTVKFCLEKGSKAFVNMVDNKGKNAITHAFECGRTNCLAEMLNNPKCDPAKSLALEEYYISTRIEYEKGLQLFRKHESIPHEQSRTRDKITLFQVEKDFAETSGEHELITLAEKGKHCEMKILELISTGANIWCTNGKGQNLLMIAAQRGMVHVVRHCVSRASYGDLHAVDKTGQTALAHL